MKIQVAIECQNCYSADATVLAQPTWALSQLIDLHKNPWKLCGKCADEKTKYGPCWKAVGQLTPVEKEL